MSKDKNQISTAGVFDQGIREWLRFMYRVRREDGMDHDEAQAAVYEQADANWTYWRVQQRGQRVRED